MILNALFNCDSLRASPVHVCTAFCVYVKCQTCTVVGVLFYITHFLVYIWFNFGVNMKYQMF